VVKQDFLKKERKNCRLKLNVRFVSKSGALIINLNER